MRTSTEFVDRNGMIDILVSGNEFKRSRAVNLSMNRINRFLFRPDWEFRFVHAIGFVLPRPILDNCPIFLNYKRVIGGPTF